RLADARRGAKLFGRGGYCSTHRPSVRHPRRLFLHQLRRVRRGEPPRYPIDVLTQMIRNMHAQMFRLIGTLSMAWLLAACSTPAADSAFDPNFEEGVPATITSVVPAGEYFAGYETITLNGSDFGSTTDDVVVWFNNT